MHTQYFENSTTKNKTNGKSKLVRKSHQVDTTIHTDEGYVEQRFETPEFVKSWSEEQKAEFAYQLLLSIPASRSLEVVDRLCPLLHRDFFSILPYEIILHILSYGDIYSLVQIGMVSKYWKKVSDDPLLWRALFIKKGWKYDQLAIKRYIEQPLLNKETKNVITGTSSTTSSSSNSSSTIMTKTSSSSPLSSIPTSPKSPTHISAVPLARTNAALYDPNALPTMPGAPPSRLRSFRRPGDIILQFRSRRTVSFTNNNNNISRINITSSSSSSTSPSSYTNNSLSSPVTISRSTPPLISSPTLTDELSQNNDNNDNNNLQSSNSIVLPHPSSLSLDSESNKSTSLPMIKNNDLPSTSNYQNNNNNHSKSNRLKSKSPCVIQHSTSDSLPKSPKSPKSPLISPTKITFKKPFDNKKENHNYQSPIPTYYKSQSPTNVPSSSSSSKESSISNNNNNIILNEENSNGQTNKNENDTIISQNNADSSISPSLSSLSSSSSTNNINSNNSNNNISTTVLNNYNNTNNSINNTNNNNTSTSNRNLNNYRHNKNNNNNNNNINNGQNNTNNDIIIEQPYPTLSHSSSNLRKLSESRLISASQMTNRYRNSSRPPLPISSYSRDSISTHHYSIPSINNVPNSSLSSSAIYQRRQLTRQQYKQILEENNNHLNLHHSLETVDRHHVVERPFKNRPKPRQHTKYDEAATYHYDEQNDKRYINWRRLYRNRHIIEKRWRNGKCFTKSFPPTNSTGQLDTHVDWIYCLQFDQKTLISGSRDHTIKIWNLSTGVCLHTLIGHTASVLCLQFDDRYIISGSSDTTMIVWDKLTGEKLKTLIGHSESVLNLKFSGNRLVSSSKDRTVRIWDLESGTTIKTLIGHRAAVNAIQFKDDLIISASGDRTIRLWNAVTGESIRTFDSHSRGIACVEFGGNRIVSGSSDQTIKIWNMETGECLHTLPGHTDLVRTLQMDQQSNRVITGSYDGSLRIWDMEKGTNLRLLNEGIDGRVLNLQFDFSKIVCCTNTAKIFIYDFARGIDTQFLA